MAATVSSPWGKPGAWALDSEENEAELQQQQQHITETLVEPEFPSLAAAAATKTKKKKQTFSIAEFQSTKVFQPSRQRDISQEDLINLPTGPRERSAEELDRSRLGGGFKGYGSNNRYNTNGGGGDESSNSRWGSSRVSGRESSREPQTSRADEIDNWAAAKKPMAPVRERGGFFDSQSKADETDSWVSNKTETRRSGFGGFDRKSSFDSLSRDRERDTGNWGKKREESDGADRPRPRLVLQPRTMPVSPIAVSPVAATPVSPVSDGPFIAVARPKGANPFGQARPREEVLAEKGKDWKEIDEKLEAAKIKDEKSDGVSFGKRGFGNGRAAFGDSRSWRKNDSDSLNGSPHSARGETVNGHTADEETVNGHTAEEETVNGHAEAKSENGHIEEEN